VFFETTAGDQLVVVGPDSGDGIWQSPALLDAIPRDASGSGVRISVATRVGMYVTR